MEMALRRTHPCELIRVNALTGAVMASEDSYTPATSLEPSLNLLNSLLSELASLDKGVLLLRFNTEDNSFSVMKAVDPSMSHFDPSGMFNLHKESIDYGQKDTSSNPFIPFSTSTRPKPLIPFMCAPKPPTKEKLFRYCYQLAHRGECRDPVCTFPHYMREEVAEIKRRYASQSGERRARKAKKIKKQQVKPGPRPRKGAWNVLYAFYRNSFSSKGRARRL